jgi:hypothetical protein
VVSVLAGFAAGLLVRDVHRAEAFLRAHPEPDPPPDR